MNRPLSSILEFYSNFKHGWSALEKSTILSTFKCTWWSSTLDDQVHLIKMQFYETQVHLIQAQNPYEVCFIQDTSVGVLNRTWWSSALDKGQFHKIGFINFSLSSVIESSALESSALHKGRFIKLAINLGTDKTLIIKSCFQIAFFKYYLLPNSYFEIKCK